MALTDTLHMTASTEPLPTPILTISDLATTAGSKVVSSTAADLSVAQQDDILYIETGDNIGYYIVDSSNPSAITLYEALEFSHSSTVKAYVYRVYPKLNTQAINIVSDRSDRMLKLTRLYGDLSSRYFMGHTSDTAMPEVWYNSPPTNREVSDGVGTKAVGSVTAPAPDVLNDGDDLTISDGTSTVKFHIDKSGTYVPLGGYNASNVRLDIGSASSSDDVASILDTAISGSALNITPTRTDSLLELEAIGIGSAYNQTITEELVLGGSTFSPVGMAGGSQTEFDDVNGRPATGQLVAVAPNELANGNNFLLGDGINPSVRYYFNRTGTYVPVGGWSTERVEIDVSGVSTADEVAELMRSAIAGTPATGRLSCPDPSDLADGDGLSIGDGTASINFWMDLSGTYVPGTGYDSENVQVNLVGATDPEHVAQAIREAVYGSALGVVTNDQLTNVVTLENTTSGIVGNVAITEHVVSGESFNPQGMAGGNGTTMALTVSGTGPYVMLENTSNGTVGNVPIESIMTVASLNEQGMSGGLDPWSVDAMNGYLQASMVCAPATAGAFNRYSLTLSGALVDPSVGTRVLTQFTVKSWESEGSFILGLNNGQVSPTLDGNDRFGVEFFKESDDEVRVRLEFGGVVEQTYMPINATAMVDRDYMLELEITGSGGDRATCRLFELPDVDDAVATVSVDKTASVTYDRFSLTTEGAVGGSVELDVRYVDVEIGTGTVVDATGGILLGEAKFRLFRDRYLCSLVTGDGAKTITGVTADLVDTSVDEVLTTELETVAPVVLLNGLTFESGVEEAGYPKISTNEPYDQLEISFTSNKSGTYYVKLDSTAFTNGLLITSGSCVGGVGKVVPMFTQDLTGAGARDGLHELQVYVQDDAGNVGSAS